MPFMNAYQMPVVDDRAIWDLWLSQHHLPSITVADEIGLFTALEAGPRDTAALAEACDVEARALGIVLGLIAALGFIVRREGDWNLTSVSRTYLLPDGNFYWGPLIMGGRDSDPLHAALLGMLRPGEKASPIEGRPVENWESGQLGSEQARSIARFMHAHSLPAAIGASRTGRFAGVTSLLDVGGGSGVFSIAAALAEPGLRATIMELPAMCEAARDYIAEADVAGRVGTTPVDIFRKDWPTGHDALFFSNIYHDWNEATNRELSAKAFAALPSGGRIFLHEQLMDDTLDGPVTTASFSVLMLRGTRGKQYSLGELTAILESAGFKGVRATHSCGYYSLVEAVKP